MDRLIEVFGRALAPSAALTLILLAACGEDGSTTAPRTWTVTATAGAGGSISPASQVVSHGDSTSFAVTADEGYGIESVAGCNGSLADDTYTTGPVTADCTVTAAFTQGAPPVLHVITVSASPAQGGSVSGGGSYGQGSEVTVNAMANTGYGFVDWTDGGARVSSSASYTFNATANRALVANFSLDSYTLGGVVTGLAGTVVLRNNGGDDLTITADGPFTFATSVAHGGAYHVTVASQPEGQVCTASGNTGVATGNVTSVSVVCSADSYGVGGTVSGLSAGETVVLHNNGGDDLPVDADGPFAFSTPVAVGASYDVTVAVQPFGKLCAVAQGAGEIGSADVDDVAVTCTAASYAIGGNVIGLAGTLVLQNGGADDLTLTADGAFSFGTPIVHGTTYDVTVLAQPVGQTCAVTSGAGTVHGADVTSVFVACALDSYLVSGAVSGLSGALVLQNNGGDDRVVHADGPFSFATAVEHGADYEVTVLVHPEGQTCTVTNGSGTIAGAHVNDVAVTCATAAYAIGGTVSGLAGTLVLQNDGGDELSVGASGTFAFATPLEHGASYDVTVLAQPVGQTCIVESAAGTATATVTSVTVTCSNNPYTLGGTVSGLVDGALVLQNEGGDDLTLNGNGSFVFAAGVLHGSSYEVTVLSQPSGQSCAVTGGAGTIHGASVTTVAIQCAPNSYTIGGAVSGLAGTLVLRNDGGDDLTLGADGSFTFATPIEHGSSFNVTIASQPADQFCSAGSNAGVVAAADVTSVVVTCSTNAQTIGGTISGLTGTVVLRNNGGDDLTLGANGSFTFSTPVAQGATYAVTVATQPNGQTCSVSNGAGAVGGAAVTSVAIGCETAAYTVDATVTGLAGSLVLRNNGGDDLAIGTNGSFSFAQPVLHGSSYDVTVKTQPVGQTCTVTGGSGTATASVDVAVSCTSNSYTVGGALSGLSGTVVLKNNGGDALELTADGTFAFSTPLLHGSPYAVTVHSQPVGQLCIVTRGVGFVYGANVANVAVSCTTQSYLVGVSVSGVSGSLTLRNNGGDDLVVTGSGSYAFATPLLHGSSYAVTVATQPVGQQCAVTNGSGTINGADVSTISVSCTNLRYAVGGALTGMLSGHSLVLQLNGKENLTVSAAGAFTFTTTLIHGASYTATILSQPVGHHCTISKGAGVIDGAAVTDIGVGCAPITYKVGGTLSGLYAGNSLIVTLNGNAEKLTLRADGNFTFSKKVAHGSTYTVTHTTPTGQTCTLTNGSGTVQGANVTNVAITCTRIKYSVGGTVTGLDRNESVTVKLDRESLSVASDGRFTFDTTLYHASSYAVTLVSAPAGKTCSITNGSGTINGANVNDIGVACTLDHTIGGTVADGSGAGTMTGPLVLINTTNGDEVTVSRYGAYTFPLGVPTGSQYNVKVKTQPSGSTCAVSNGAGTMGSANVTNIEVTCTRSSYTVGGTASGIPTGDTVVLNDNGADDLAVNANGSFTFATPLLHGSTYDVTVASVPPGLRCTVSNGAGTATTNVTSVSVECAGFSWEHDLSSVTTYSAFAIDVATDADCNAVMHWDENIASSGSKRKVWGSTYDPASRSWSAKAALGESDTSCQLLHGVSLDMTSSGKGVSAWAQNDSCASAGYLQVASNLSGTWNTPLASNDRAVGADAATAGLSVGAIRSAVAENGDVVVVFKYKPNTDSATHHLMVRERRAGVWATRDISSNLWEVTDHEVAIADDGTTLILREHTDLATGKQVLYYSQYRNGAWSHPVYDGTSSTTQRLSPADRNLVYDSFSLAMNRGGEAIIAFATEIYAQGITDVTGLIYDNGAWSSPVQLKPVGYADPYVGLMRPVAAIDGAGHVVVAYLSQVYADNILYKAEKRGSSWSVPSSVSDAIGHGPLGTSLHVAMDELGRSFIAWSSTQSGALVTRMTQYDGSAWETSADFPVAGTPVALRACDTGQAVLVRRPDPASSSTQHLYRSVLH